MGFMVSFGGDRGTHFTFIFYCLNSEKVTQKAV